MSAARPSMRAAINAMCRQCIYDPLGGFGTWRQQTEACTSPGCPLYPLRPVSAGESEKPAVSGVLPTFPQVSGGVG